MKGREKFWFVVILTAYGWLSYGVWVEYSDFVYALWLTGTIILGFFLLLFIAFIIDTFLHPWLDKHFSDDIKDQDV